MTDRDLTEARRDTETPRGRLSRRLSWKACLLAAGATALAVLLRWLLGKAFADLSPFITFYPAVALAAMLLGTRAGVLTTVLSAIAAAFFFISPYHSLAVASLDHAVGAALFAVNGLLICWMAELLSRAQQRQTASERENLLRALSEGIPDPLFIKDRDSRVIMANAPTARAVGKPLERIVGHTDAEFFDDPAAAQARMAVDRQVMESGQPLVMEDVVPATEGPRTFLTIKTPWRDEDGRIIGIIGCARDITDRKRAEETLRESEERYRATFDNAALGIVEVDAHHRFVSANSRALQILGYRLEEFVGMTVHELTYPEDRPASDEINAQLRDGRLDRFDREKRYLKRDGSPLWVHVTVSAIRDSAGRFVRGIGTIGDVSERKRAEEALRESEAGLAAAQRLAHIGSWQWDVQNDEARWSEETFRIFGLACDPLEQHRKGFGEMVHPEDRQRVDQALTDALNGTREYDLDYRIRRPDGLERVIHAQAEVLRSGDGKPVMMRGTVHDITERKQAEQQLREWSETLEQRVAQRTAEAKYRATQLQRLAGQLTRVEQQERQQLATLLHDHLQQLLVGVKYRLNTLRKQPLQEGYLQSLRQAEELLDTSLKTSRSLTAELSPPILHEGTLAQLLHWLARWAKEKYGLTVPVLADEEADLRIPEMRVLIFQAVRELLLNVVKHAGVDRASITLSRKGPNRVQILVADEGGGFAWPQEEAGAAGSVSGSGFGLFSIRERLELMGGSMQIDSQPGRGARITLTAASPELTGGMSAEAPAGQVLTSEHADRQGVERQPQAQNVIRVLLADDHEVVRTGLARLLQMEPDIEVAGQAADGQETVEIALRTQPDVILMDVSMPRMGGVEATRRLTRQMPGIKIIGLSMHEQEDVAASMKAAGAARYLTKTSPPEALVTAVRECAAERPSQTCHE